MKKSLILLPLLLIFAIVIFFIFMSQAISKEVENDTKQLELNNEKEIIRVIKKEKNIGILI